MTKHTLVAILLTTSQIQIQSYGLEEFHNHDVA